MKKLLSTLILSAVFLVGCGGGEASEKERFIDANVELACILLEAGTASATLEEDAKAIFREHGFDVDDETPVNPGCDPSIIDLEDENRCITKMESIAAKYAEDPDVQEAIIAALQECPGDLKDIFEDMEGAFEDMEIPAASVTE